GRRPGRVLDLGWGSGHVAAELRKHGHVVVGVGAAPESGTAARLDRLVVADLDAGLPAEASAEGPFDVVVAADVLEHLRAPDRLLRELHAVCKPDAVLLASIPNIGHWYPRLRIGLGRVDHHPRGLLDPEPIGSFPW